MKLQSMFARAVLALVLGATGAAAQAQVVISQVYGGGGNTSATYTHDYVEIFNRGDVAVFVGGWTVQYTSTSGTTWSVSSTLPGVSLEPGQYFLVQLASGGAVGDPLPTPDHIGGSINMAASNGKVALASDNVAFSGTCPAGTNLIDFVGFGTANCSEGGAAAPAGSNSSAVFRNGGGCTDTEVNSNDFMAAVAAARNSATAFNVCEGGGEPPFNADSQLVISQVYGGGGNTNAPFNQDFVELFNRGETVVLLEGLSLQYGPATGDFAGGGVNSPVALPPFGLQPGQYFLVGFAGGAVGADLPPVDASGGANLAQGSAKVALVQGVASLGCGSNANPCSPAQLDNVLDLVGFGTANLWEGSAAAPAPSATTAIFRAGAGCIDSDQNAADFSTATPAPRNSATPQSTCSVAAPGEEPTLNLFDAAVLEGDSGDFPVIRFLVQLTSPAVTEVSFDIESFDTGSAVDGVDYIGDAVVGASIGVGQRDYVFEITVIGNDEFQGNRSFGVAIDNLSLDAFPGRLIAEGVIIEDEPVPTSICEIQESGIEPSPLLGARPNVFGIVTAFVGNGYYVQHSDAVRDADPLCSDEVSSGIFVFQGGGFNPGAAGIAIGDFVMVTGTVQEFVAGGFENQFGLRQLSDFATTEVLSSGHALPTPAVLDPVLDLGPDAGADRLQRYVGMRASAPPLRLSGPSLASYNADTGAVTPFGTYFGTPVDQPRPFREEGVSVVDRLVDVVPFPPEIDPPIFDANPEVLRIDSIMQQDATRYDPEVGTVVSGLQGVLTYSFNRYTLAPDPDNAPVFDTSAVVQPTGVSAAPYEAVSVASFNVLNLNDLTDDFGNLPVLDRRLDEQSEAICVAMHTPDIIGLSEVGDLVVLQKLAAAVNDNSFGHCDFNPQYQAHFSPPTFIGQGVGLLVATYEVSPGMPRVSVNAVVREGGEDVLLATPLKPPNPAALNDRAPLRLDAVINQDNGAQFAITVISNHMRSLSALTDARPPAPGSQTAAEGWDTRGQRVREKRVQGAAWLAGLVQDRQLADAGERIMLIGDFNAYEFSDGYVDVMGIVTGLPTPADQVLLAQSEVAGEPPPVLVDPPLLNLTTALPPEERYSFVFEGSAQTLDHIVVNQPLITDALAIDVQHARINADFAGFKLAHPDFPERVSDHDPVVAHVSVPDFRSADLAVSALAEVTPILPGDPAVFTVTVANPGPNAAENADLNVNVNMPCGLSSGTLEGPDGWSCSGLVNVFGSLVGNCTHPGFAIDEADFTVTAFTCDTSPAYNVMLTTTIESSTADRTPDDNVAQAVIEVQAEADLEVTLSGPPGPVDVGSQVAIQLAARNLGPSTVGAASEAFLTIDVNVPPLAVMLERDGSDLFACTSPNDDGVGGSRIECDLVESAETGALESFVVQVTVPASLSGQSLQVVAGISSDIPDPESGNNEDAVSVAVGEAAEAIFANGFEQP